MGDKKYFEIYLQEVDLIPTVNIRKIPHVSGSGRGNRITLKYPEYSVLNKAFSWGKLTNGRLNVGLLSESMLGYYQSPNDLKEWKS